eukprot:1142841-Pelagomonas_calceolata.AAC.12
MNPDRLGSAYICHTCRAGGPRVAPFQHSNWCHSNPRNAASVVQGLHSEEQGLHCFRLRAVFQWMRGVPRASAQAGQVLPPHSQDDLLCPERCCTSPQALAGPIWRSSLESEAHTATGGYQARHGLYLWVGTREWAGSWSKWAVCVGRWELKGKKEGTEGSCTSRQKAKQRLCRQKNIPYMTLKTIVPIKRQGALESGSRRWGATSTRAFLYNAMLPCRHSLHVYAQAAHRRKHREKVSMEQSSSSVPPATGAAASHCQPRMFALAAYRYSSW